MKRHIGLFMVLVMLVFAPTVIAGQAPAPQQPAGGLPDLVGALKATPGCLGVETARTSSGKQVIFAWFENKKAVLNWYYSDTHQAVMQLLGGAKRPGGPLAGIPDEAPVLAIASITLTGAPESATDLRSVTTQIAIELYQPLPGGLAAGGRFAPAALKVPGMVEVRLSSVPKQH